MKIGFACGVFDLFHAGHVLMLQECKSNCDYLIVGLNKAGNLSSEKNKPVYSIEERQIIIASSKYVDEVLIYNSEEELMEVLKNKHFKNITIIMETPNDVITGDKENMQVVSNLLKTISGN